MKEGEGAETEHSRHEVKVPLEPKKEPTIVPEVKRWLVFSISENTRIEVLNVCAVYEDALKYVKDNAVYNMGRPAYISEIKEFRKV